MAANSACINTLNEQSVKFLTTLQGHTSAVRFLLFFFSSSFLVVLMLKGTLLLFLC